MERQTLIVDASVIVKWFAEEEDEEKATEIREQFYQGQIEIIVPDLILYELSNALRFNPKFNEEDVKSAIQSIYETGINIVEPQIEILNEAIDLSFSKNISFYDSYYVALSKYSGYLFVTADQKLYGKIKDVTEVILLKEY